MKRQARSVDGEPESGATETRSAEQERFTHRLKSLIHINNELASSESGDELVRKSIELARERLGFGRLGVWFRVPGEQMAQGSFGTDENGQIRDERECRVFLDSDAYIRELMDAKSEVAICRDGHLRDSRGKKVGKGTWVCAAMWSGQDVLGYVMMDNLLEGQPVTASDCELLALFASMLGSLCSRLQTEQALRDSESAYRATLDAMRDAIHVVDRNLRIVLVNQRFQDWCRELGLGEEITGKQLCDVFPFLPDSMREEYKQVFETGEVLFTEEDLEVDGNEIITEVKKVPVSENGQVVRVLTVVRDVTLEKGASDALAQSREQLQQAQKMEALGRLAGGIAHDFNNLLTTILGYGHLVHERLGDDDPAKKEVSEIVSAGERAVELTTQLLSIGRRRQEHVRPVNINTVVIETDRLLRRTLGEDIELVTIPGEELDGVKVESGKIQQVLMNLAINARDAMVNGGTLTIETTKVRLDEKDLQPRAGFEPGYFVCLSVRDTGDGMDEEVQKHIFEPFYTTKGSGKGSGLGLAMVYGIVNQAGGWIELESEPGKGTTFKIFFPCEEEMTAEVLPSTARAELPKGSEKVLVVEDEQTVRHFTVKILKTLGYDVLEAGNGQEALSMFQKHKGTIDLVLTDIVMPLMSGKELVKKLKEVEAPCKVLFMSGFSDETVSDAGTVVLMQKPFTRETLARLLRQVLDEQK